MKTTIASLLLLLATAPAVLADGEDALPADAGFKPKEYPLSKYSHLDKKSPFEFDPPPPPPVDNVDNFEGVSLGGYCGNGNSLTVYIIEGKDKKRLTVYGDGSPFKKRDTSGYRIISLNRGSSLKTTTVLLEKGGQQKEIGFEKETLTAKAGGAAGGPQVQMVPGPDGRMVPRPVIPRPAGSPAGQPQAYQSPAPFIPGQNNAPQNPGAVQGNQGGFQPSGGMAPQQLVNQLVTNPNIPQQGMNTGTGAPGQTSPQAPVIPPRRRVVLPTNTPSNPP